MTSSAPNSDEGFRIGRRVSILNGTHQLIRGDRVATDYFRSDHELASEVLAGWERLRRVVAPGPDWMDRLATRSSMSFRALDRARLTRHRIAHPTGPVPREDLLRALGIIQEVERKLGEPAPYPDRGDTHQQTYGDARDDIGSRRTIRGNLGLPLTLLVSLVVFAAAPWMAVKVIANIVMWLSTAALIARMVGIGRRTNVLRAWRWRHRRQRRPGFEPGDHDTFDAEGHRS